MPKRIRIAVLLLALFAMLGVSAVASTPAHFHLDSSPNRCDLCFTAHVSVVQSPSMQPVHAIEVYGRATVLLPYFGYKAFSGPASSSRGPPSCAL